MPYAFDFQSGLVSAIVNVLVASVFIYFAARFVLDRSSIIAAVLTAFVATFLALLVAALVPGVWGLVAAVAVWALVAAVLFRAKWVQGAIIGLVSWVLWVLVSLLVTYLMGRFG